MLFENEMGTIKGSKVIYHEVVNGNSVIVVAQDREDAEEIGQEWLNNLSDSAENNDLQTQSREDLYRYEIRGMMGTTEVTEEWEEIELEEGQMVFSVSYDCYEHEEKSNSVEEYLKEKDLGWAIKQLSYHPKTSSGTRGVTWDGDGTAIGTVDEEGNFTAIKEGINRLERIA